MYSLACLCVVMLHLFMFLNGNKFSLERLIINFWTFLYVCLTFQNLNISSVLWSIIIMLVCQFDITNLIHSYGVSSMVRLFWNRCNILYSAAYHFFTFLKISKKKYFRLGKFRKFASICIGVITVVNFSQCISKIQLLS